MFGNATKSFRSDALMEECVRMMQQSLREAVPVKKRVKSVYNQRNLGTIKERKKEKKQEKEISNGETIMRILRMRYTGLLNVLLPSLTILDQTKYSGVYRTTAGEHDRCASRTRANAGKPAA